MQNRLDVEIDEFGCSVAPRATDLYRCSAPAGASRPPPAARSRSAVDTEIGAMTAFRGSSPSAHRGLRARQTIELAG
jgi:hypothetical protein